MNTSEYTSQYAEYVAQLDQQLKTNCEQLFSKHSIVAQAAQYSLLNGGKRVRGVLTLSVSEMLGGDPKVAAALGASVEMLHCYSLIHDDLPCMDDADLRRGKPACHKQYGEANALLAGDALLTAAFAALAAAPASDSQKAQAMELLAHGAGAQGMVYGQELDLAFENRTPSRQDLLQIHQHKTGALIKTAVLFGAVAAEQLEQVRSPLSDYADKLGLVFQIVDDVLDVTASAEQLGKPVGNDAADGKITFATLEGVESCRAQCSALTEQACLDLQKQFGVRADFLVQLAQTLCGRSF